MHATKVAEKLRAQIHQFSGIISPPLFQTQNQIH